MILGHIGISALLQKLFKLDLVEVAAAGIFPDVVDKTLCQVLGITKSGRMYAHTLAGLLGTTSMVWAFRGKHKACSWFAGYLGYLAADSTGSVPWLFPFVAYEFKKSPGFQDILLRTVRRPMWLAIEIVLFGWGITSLRSALMAKLWTKG